TKPFPFMMDYRVKDPEFMRAMNEHVPIANSQPVRSENHAYLSAFAPVYDSKGEFVAILGVDMVLDSLDARMASLKRAIGVALLVVLVLSVVAGYVALRIRKFSAAIVSKLRIARARAEENAA